jgi:N-methylhydantoinase A/acetophenone carboxylase
LSAKGEVMGYSVDIDTGGTFTDGFVRGDGKIELVKVATTPHDLTLCFMECIEEAAKKLGYASASQMLPHTDTVRLSTTIGTNALINASGPKLGLVATRGLGENAYAPIGAANPAVNFLVPAEMIFCLDEEMTPDGVSVRPPSSAEVLAGVKSLLERGARRIVVSLAHSPLNPAHEKLCRDFVLANYPAHYLGTVPLLLSTEVSTELEDLPRTNAALIDAYIHQEMQHYLYKADDDVRRNRFKWPLLIVHSTGGVCRVAKTKAIDTCDSGPAAGLFGAAFLARTYGLDNVVTCDIGGTSTDIGVVKRGAPLRTSEKELGGIPVREEAIETVSIGGGGSSIVRVDNRTKKLTVGPESAGGIPGPACFGLGGTNACMTDAWLTLGYVDPEYFLGGKKKLDPAKARAAVKRRAGDVLGVGEEQAAEAAVKQMIHQCSQLVERFLRAKGIAPRDATMFAFGGGGGIPSGSIAKAVGIPRTYFFPFGAQFCAFGSTCMDVLHDYAVAKSLELTGAGDIAAAEFNEAVESMTEDAYFDMEGEGFDKAKVSLSLEVMMSSEHDPSRIGVRWSPMALKGKDDAANLADLYRARSLTCGERDKVFVREIRLEASCHLPDPEFPQFEPQGGDPVRAMKGTRRAYWDGAFHEAKVYEQSRLQCGNVVRGLAFVESSSTTVLVPPGTRYTVDKYLNGLLEEE